MVGPNTMIAATPWIKRNMLDVEPEQEKKRPTEAELRVQRCAEKLQVPDWYRNYFKPDTKFLKDKTPFECRPPTWKTMKGKLAPANAMKKSRTAKNETSPKPQSANAKTHTTAAKSTAQPSPRKSLNSNYRISRKVDNAAKNKDQLSISITPTSSDNELDQQPVLNISSNHNEDEEVTLVDLSKSLRNQHNTSNTFPRMQPSRKIQNINIVFPENFIPKPPKCQLQTLGDDQSEDNNGSMSTAASTDAAADVSQKSNYTSFLLAEVEPRGVTTTMQMFAGLDSDESQEQDVPARCSPSPHTRFFNSEKKSIELERIVQNSKEIKRGNNSLIREIIDELDRSIAESMASSRRSQDNADEFNASQNFVKNVVRALENVSYELNYDDCERSYDEDSELAKSTSISFKSSDGASSVDEDDDGHEEESTPMPTYHDDHQKQEQEEKDEEEEQKEEEVYWIPAKIQDLARTSSRLSMMSRNSGRSGFQCTSGRCSPGLSPIKSDRLREDWTITLSSCRSQKKSRQQLFSIDETGVADSGCYSDRSGATSQSTRTPAFSDNQSPSPVSSSPSPTLTDANNQFPSSDSSSVSSLSPLPSDFDGISAAMLMKMSRRSFLPLKSVRV